MKLKKVMLGCAGTIVAGLIVWGFVESRSAWIDAGYVGILYDANQGVIPKTFPPSRIFVGWRQRLYTYPTKLQSAKYVQDPEEGETRAADGILITTSDNANTMFDVCVIYRIAPENALKVFNAFGAVDVETIQTQHLRRAIKDAVNEIGPKYDVFELMGTKRSEFCQLATQTLQNKMENKGITIDSLYLMTAYPTPETAEKINRRVNQYTEYDIAVLRKQIAEVNRQTNVIAAQAKMSAAQLTSATAVDKGIEQLQLQADEEAVERWDGHLPPIRMGGGQTMILDGSTLAALSKRQSAPAPPRGQKAQPEDNGQ